MYLRRIELQGFKTFPRRTVLELPPGMTAIVGPNGAGKSNLGDAIRWALGEQSPRMLRIRKADEVIFAGTESRARTGMAEVLLTFDNADGWLPTEFDEVVIGRRLFRSGDSEYTLNGSRVRLRDIVDLMSAGGAGNSGHSIINQGQVDATLQHRPEERRAFVEEVAGVARFYARRDQARRRLDATRRNLERLRDLVAEIEPRLDTLRLQAEVAERGLELQDELRGSQDTVARHRLFVVSQKLDEAEAREQEAAGAMAAISAEPVERLRQRAAEAELRTKDLESSVMALRAGVEALRDRAAELAGRRRLLHERHANLAARHEDAQRRLATLTDQAEALRQQAQTTVDVLGELQERIDVGQARRERLIALVAPERAHARERESQRAALEEARDALAALRERQRQVEAEHERLNAELDQIVDDTRAQRARADAAAGVADRAAKDADAAAEAFDASSAARQTAEQEQDRAQEALSAASQAGSRLVERVDSMRDEQAALGRLQEQTGTPDRVYHALHSSPAGGALQGRLGETFAELEPDARLLLLAAFGSALDDVLIRDANDAPEAGRAVAELALGRIRLRPARGLLGWPYEPEAPPPKGDGILGTLADLVGVKPTAPPVVERLLHGVLVVEDLATALRIRAGRREISSYLLVTMQGEAIDPDGTIRVGTPGGGMADVAVRFEHLAKEIERAERELGTARDRMGKLEAVLVAAKAAREAAGAALTERKNAHLRTHVTAAEAMRQHQRLDARAAAAAERQQAVRERLHELAGARSSVRSELAEAEARVDRLRQRVEAADASNGGAAPPEAELVAVEAALTADRERHDELRAQQAARDLALGSLDAQVTAERERGEMQAQAQAQAEREGGEVERETGAISTRLEQSRGELQQGEADLIESRLEAQRLQLQTNQCEWEQRKAQTDLDAAQAATERLAERRGELRRYAREELGTDDLRPARADVPVSRLERRVGELRRMLETLGPVNPLAPAEYRDETTRVEEAKRQIADLDGAEAKLRALATDLQRQLQAEFMTTFEAVNEAFGRLFREMFDGGEARMELTAPGDMETTGVEILVRAPGKRQQELAALSGGERALVSTALILAVMHVRPSPFCVLDEVDAALDEANIARFCAQIDVLCTRTQFIVITHNPITIQAAATIYGVSMEESGVSRLLSLHVDQVPGNGRDTNGTTNGQRDASPAADVVAGQE